MNTREILQAIEQRQLYTFKAKDPLKVIGSAIRQNLINGKPSVIEESEKGRYVAASRSD